VPSRWSMVPVRWTLTVLAVPSMAGQTGRLYSMSMWSFYLLLGGSSGPGPSTSKISLAVNWTRGPG
jgi:hypothetical protein